MIRNTNRGTLTAEARVVHRGRSTIVVDVKVSDDQARLLASLVATLLAPTPGQRPRPAGGLHRRC